MEAAGANAGMMGARLIENFRQLMPRSCERYRMSACGPSVWTGRALQAESDDLEVMGLALLYPALERNV
jgi:hypothetical protein